MKKNLSILMIVMFITQVCVFPIHADEDVIHYAAVNPEYTAFYKKRSSNANSNDYNSENYNGIIPNEYVIPYIDDSDKDNDEIEALSNNLPSSYNTSNAKQYVSSVKNQMNLGTCWDFASTAALEGYLLKTNNSSNNNEYDFSENHARYATSNDNNNPYGYNRLPDDGGTFNMMRTYWTRGKVNGPVDESDDPYDNLIYENGGRRTVEETESFSKRNIYVKDTIELPDLSSTPTSTQIAKHISDIKNLVYDYGGVYLHTRINTSNMNYSTMAYYNSEVETINHAVCIVGWDDNYSIDNFKSGQQPTMPGAFVVKNSWGNWGNKGGYYYMSYQCANNFPSISAVSDVDTRDFYDNLYEYDELGRGNSFGYGANRAIVGANVFTKKSNGCEYLNAVSAYIAAPNTFIKVYACDGDDFSQLKEIDINGRGPKYNSGYLISDAGSVTLEFSEDVHICKDKYVVAIEVINEDYAFPMVCESRNTNVEYRAKANESYYASSLNNLINSPNPISAGDDNICIKAFTKNRKSEWNFSSEEFSDYRNVLTTPQKIHGLQFNASKNYPLYIDYSRQNINGWQYTRPLVMQGGDNVGRYTNDGTVEVNVNGPTEIYIAAKANSDSNTQNVLTSAMHVYDKNGREITEVSGNNSYAEGSDVKKFVYSNTEKAVLKIAPGTSTMKVFGIYLRPLKEKDTTKVNNYWDLKYNVQTYDGLELLSGVYFENYAHTNSYGINFKEYAKLAHKGTNNSYGIKFYSPSNTDIYVSARASGTPNIEQRALCLVNEYGYILGYSGDKYNPSLDTDIFTYRFSYSGNYLNGENLYIRSLDSGVHIFDIRVKSRNENNNGVEDSINFDNTFFDGYGIVNEALEYNDTFTVSPGVRLWNRVRTYGLKTYNRCLSLLGQGSSETRNLKIHVPGNVKITVIATHGGADSDIRELALFDENGYIVGRKNINTQLNKYEFTYTGGENTLYLRSKEYGMYLYEVNVSSGDYDEEDISNNYNNNVGNTASVLVSDKVDSGASVYVVVPDMTESGTAMEIM